MAQEILEITATLSFSMRATTSKLKEILPFCTASWALGHIGKQIKQLLERDIARDPVKWSRRTTEKTAEQMNHIGSDVGTRTLACEIDYGTGGGLSLYY